MPNFPSNFVPFWTNKITQVVDDCIMMPTAKKIIYKKPHLGKMPNEKNAAA